MVDGPDEVFAAMVDQYDSALNPFGIQYGSVQYLGLSASSADITAAYSPDTSCPIPGGCGGLASDSGFWIVRWPTKASNWMEILRVFAMHEFAHVYLKAPDYTDNPACGGGNLSYLLVDQTGLLTPKGRAAIAYWALIRKYWDR